MTTAITHHDEVNMDDILQTLSTKLNQIDAARTAVVKAIEALQGVEWPLDISSHEHIDTGQAATPPPDADPSAHPVGSRLARSATIEAARKLMTDTPNHDGKPGWSVEDLANALKVTSISARRAIRDMEADGEVREVTGQARGRRYSIVAAEPAKAEPPPAEDGLVVTQPKPKRAPRTKPPEPEDELEIKFD